MKKYWQLILVCAFGAIPVWAQFTPNYQNNYFAEKNKWAAYFDSLANNTPGLSSLYGTGYSAFLKWRYHWERYMTDDGNFDHARANKQLIVDYIQNNNPEPGNPNYLIQQNCNNWKETGPNTYENILGYYDGEWKNPHVTNPNTKQFFGGVGRFDRLFQHPTQPTTLYTISGDYEQSGSGLFVTFNYGQQWTCISDKVPTPEQSFFSFAVVPSNANNLNSDILFLGSVDNNVFRSTNNGQHWEKINVNMGNLPSNINRTINNTGIFKIFFIPGPSGPYHFVALCTKMGMYYSSNYTSTTPSFQALPLPPIPDEPGKIAIYSFTDAEVITKNNQNVLIVNAAVNYMDSNQTENTFNVGTYCKNFLYSGSISINNNTINTISYTQLSSLSDNLIPKSFRGPANIQCKKNEPSVIFVAYNATTKTTFPIFKYTFASSSWSNESKNVDPQGITPKAHGFELVLTNEEDRMFLCNYDYYRKNGTDYFEPSGNYGVKKHPDVRDVLIDYHTNPPVMWIATDAAIYKNTDWNNQNIPSIFNPASEGLNATMVDQLSVAQQPPYYIATGVYHSSYQALDPGQGIWHYWDYGWDGKLGLIPFLKNDVFLLNSINSSADRYKDFVNGFDDTGSPTNISNKSYSTVFAFSENRENQAYCMNADNMNILNIYDQFLPNPAFATISRSLNLSAQLLTIKQSIIAMPNDPDRILLVSSNNNNLRLLFIHQINTAPAVEQIIEIPQITTPDSTFNYPGQTVYIAADPNYPKKFYLVYRSYARWNDVGANSKGVIFEYHPEQNSFSDITYAVEGESGFPKAFTIKDLVMDRQTGVLYISTNVGVFYLDKHAATGPVWKKHSCNLPNFPGDLDACHCNGKLYTANGYRGIWESTFIRQGFETRQWKIENNTTWHEDMNLFCTLVIEPGATLTVKNTLRVFGNHKIIVKPGARLIIDGGVVTSQCDNLWQGIEVWGNRNLHQYPINGNYFQGLLVLKNGAVIENAREAVVLFNPNDGSGGYQTSGGIVQATDAVFRNNKRSAQFISYHNYHPLQPSQERNNASFFTRCTFELTQSLAGNNVFSDFVTLWDVRGVAFTGCTFQNNGPVPATPAASGRGIYSHNAHYLVGPFCPTLACTNPQPSVFKNLRVGVWAAQVGGNRSFSVTGSQFQHCQVGVVNDGVSNARIQQNLFLPGSHPAGYSFIHTGLALLNTITNYTVSHNQFLEAPNPVSQLSIGIWNYHTGISDKTILNNTCQQLFIGMHAEGLNRNPLNITQGLDFQCNTHLQGDYDFFVTDGPQQVNGFGIRPSQGSNQSPAGNKFSNNGNVPPFGDFNNSSSTHITYFYKANAFSEDPQDISPNISKSVTSSNNLLCTTVPSSGFNDISQQLLAFSSYNQQYQTWKNLLSSLIDGGNTPGIKNRIHTAPVNETLILRQELLSKAPYLSDEALKEAADRTELLPEAILFELLLANPNALQSGKLMQHLRNKAQPLPEWMLLILEAAKGQVTLRTLIESAVSYYGALRSHAIRDIITWYEENDSLYNETEVRGWYAQYQHYQADMAVIESFIKQGLFAEAQSFMQSVPYTYTLSDWEKADWENYTAFMEFYISVLQSGKKEHRLDTAAIQTLQQLADNPLPYTGSARARAWLNFFYGYDYWTDPYLPVETSMKTASVSTTNGALREIDVYPNPCADWMSFSYCFADITNDIILQVFNTQGTLVWKEQLTSPCGVKVIETSHFQPGLYTYLIHSATEKLAKGSFIKN